MAGITEAQGSSLLLDDDLASIANGKGASLVAVEDAGGNFAGADVEAVLAELFTSANFLSAIVTKSAPYTLVAGDRGKLFDVSGTTTITLLAAATAGSGFIAVIRNAGAGIVTVDGNGAETINGSATLTLSVGHWAIITCDGTNWSALAYTPASSTSTSGLANYNKDILLQYGGDESDGAFSSIGASTLSDPVYNHTTFALNAGHIITVDVPVVIIRATTSIVIDGDFNGKGADISAGAGALLARLGSSLGASGGGGGGGGKGTTTTIIASNGEDGEDTYFQKGGAGGKGWNNVSAAVAGSVGSAVATNQKTLLNSLFSNLIARGGGAGGNGGLGGTGENGGNYYLGGSAGVGGLAGALIILIAPIITLSAVTTIDLTGEAGSAGGNTTWGGGGGGGGGGAGGSLMLVSPAVTDSGATITVAAGAGGSTTGTGSPGAGAAGAAGYSYTIDPTA